MIINKKIIQKKKKKMFSSSENEINWEKNKDQYNKRWNERWERIEKGGNQKRIKM